MLDNSLGKAAGRLDCNLWVRRSTAFIEVAASGDHRIQCVQRFSATVHPHLPACRSCISQMCQPDAG